MILAIGTKVWLKHTGDEGLISKVMNDGMYQVYLEDLDTEIPTHIDDLLDEEPVAPSAPQPTKATPAALAFEQVDIPYMILKSWGIQLVFDPVLRGDGTTEGYFAYLLNDTQKDVLYDIHVQLNAKAFANPNGKLSSMKSEEIGFLRFNELNDGPEYQIKCQVLTTAGLEDEFEKTIKIKAKQFFNNVRTAPLLNRPVHWYQVFEKLEKVAVKENEDLKTYTKRNAQAPKLRTHIYKKYTQHDVHEFAEFNNELDLHIEKLRPNASFRLKSSDILRVQLNHFESYIDKAIRLGVDRVFIIHGVGKGKLKNEIASRLLQNRDVVTFKNEFHPRYGWGATEVIF